MDQNLAIKFCGKPVSEHDLDLIVSLIKEFPGIPRKELAATACELLDWQRPNGKLKTSECTRLLESLEERGLFVLPKKRKPGRGKIKPIARTVAGRERSPIAGKLSQLGGVTLEPVTNGDQRALFRELVDRYHYLGYSNPFGARLRYLIKSGREEILGCLQFTSPAWKVSARDRWIGWTTARREANLQQVVQNSRFLILPWVKVSHLASHVLGQAARRLPSDWWRMYGIRPMLLETFVEERFAATSYRAANWLELGKTRGRGRMDKDHREVKAIKTVWVLPLHRRARIRLRGADIG